MSKKYEQFLGSTPGLIVEMISEDKSPFKVKTESGFEFWLSSEDFTNYYREIGSPTPEKWKVFLTEPASGQIEASVAKEAVDLVKLFNEAFQDFCQTRLFLNTLFKTNVTNNEPTILKIREAIRNGSNSHDIVSDKVLEKVFQLSSRARDLLANDEFAILNWPLNKPIQIIKKESLDKNVENNLQKKPSEKGGQRMKNVALEVEGEILVIRVDLSKEFGPSKSGKTVIVASTEGNKSVPGRSEKVGLNVYKDLNAAKKIGNKSSFKNMEMELNAEELIIRVDLSKEMGPSKSGKTVIIGSTGGNQLVYGRSEKIGLNVYKAL